MGTYVGVRFTSDTVSKLRLLQRRISVPEPLAPEHFHSTIVYSRKPIEWLVSRCLGETASVVGFDVFTNRATGGNCLVMKIESRYLRERFDLAMSMGATYDFPAYEPHVTLSYDIGDFDVSRLDIPDLILEFGEEYTEALNDLKSF